MWQTWRQQDRLVGGRYQEMAIIQSILLYHQGERQGELKICCIHLSPQILQKLTMKIFIMKLKIKVAMMIGLENIAVTSFPGRRKQVIIYTMLNVI